MILLKRIFKKLKNFLNKSTVFDRVMWKIGHLRGKQSEFGISLNHIIDKQTTLIKVPSWHLPVCDNKSLKPLSDMIEFASRIDMPIYETITCYKFVVHEKRIS